MAPIFCCVCGKKPSRNRTLDPSTAVCSVCSSGENSQGITTPNGDAATAIDPEVNDDVVLSELTFGDLKNWFRGEVRSTIKDIMKEELKTELDNVKKNISDTKALADKNSQTTAANTTKIEKLSGNFKALEKEQKDTAKISKDNLKYLVNLDRNERRQNVIFFGVPEGDMVINSVTHKSDIDKCNALFHVMKVTDVCRNAVRDIFRLGKISEEEPDKRRPLKVKFLSAQPASMTLKAGKELKNLQNENIYVKPDKSKKEQEEFRRIGDRKTALLAEYDNDEERIKLEKGVLFVDGVEVDRYQSVQTLF